MASNVAELLGYLRGVMLCQDITEVSDGELLARFVDHADGAAIGAILHRHGPLVMGVCRRYLPNLDDAEDAFQATFLVLVRKAASVKPRDQLVNWLYGVARLTARKARATTARRRAREVSMHQLPEPAAATNPPEGDRLAIIDEELSRLPPIYRAAVLLCAIQGQTQKEAARQLSCAEGTIAARVARARKLLARRLKQRGFSHSAAAPACGPLPLAPVHVPPPIAAQTLRAMIAVAAGHRVIGLSGNVLSLTARVLRLMAVQQLTRMLAVTVLVGFCTMSTGFLLLPPVIASAGEQRLSLSAAPGTTNVVLIRSSRPSRAGALTRETPAPICLKSLTAIVGPDGVSWTFHGEVTQPHRVARIELDGLPSLQGIVAYPNADGLFSVTVKLEPAEKGIVGVTVLDKLGQQVDEGETLVP